MADFYYAFWFIFIIILLLFLTGKYVIIFFETNKIKGFDIDWEEDFLMAEALLKTDGQIIGNELEWGD